jgi:menaquinone-dependent protoporphyrinogen oxidase
MCVNVRQAEPNNVLNLGIAGVVRVIARSQISQPAAVSESGLSTVLVSFATTEGQTRKVAERICGNARERHHEVCLYDTAALIGVPEVGAFDAVIVAASVHEQYHQDSAIDFAIAHRDQLMSKPSVFVSVSLSAATAGGQTEAQHYVDRFIATTGWSPAKTLLLGGALRWPECDYFQRQLLKHVLLTGDIAPDEGVNYEFTDWMLLQSFIDDFLASCVRNNDPSDDQIETSPVQKS